MDALQVLNDRCLKWMQYQFLTLSSACSLTVYNRNYCSETVSLLVHFFFELVRHFLLPWVSMTRKVHGVHEMLIDFNKQRGIQEIIHSFEII